METSLRSLAKPGDQDSGDLVGYDKKKPNPSVAAVKNLH